MSNAKAKTINLLLEDGTLKGVISMQDSSWNSGELYSAPRESVDLLLNSEACSKFGVYLLLSEDQVYVGQSSDLAQRIKQHVLKKDWWERVVILTKTDNSLNKAHIDYLESKLISKAANANKLDCDNKKNGNKTNVSRFDEVMLEQYLDEALFLMELIGITVFSHATKQGNEGKMPFITSVKNADPAQKEIRRKSEAKKYLHDAGIEVNKNWSYASRQDTQNHFWINPKKEMLDTEWTIVLNNQYTGELIVLKVHAHQLQIGDKKTPGIRVRKDKPLLDLKIDAETFTDTISKTDFSKFIILRQKY